MCQPIFWLAMSAFILANLLWIVVVSSQKLSVAFPVQISLVLVFNTAITITFFGEHVSNLGLLGVALILAGVMLLAT